MITIRRGTEEDVRPAMDFIDRNWKQGHPLAVSEKLFRWQYIMFDQYNFLIAEDENKKIYGFYGFVVYSKEKKPDISGNMWRVIPSGNPILGLEMTQFVKEHIPMNTNTTLGYSEKAIKIEKLLRGSVSYMKHYYRLANKNTYNVAVVKENHQEYCPQTEKLHFVQIDSYQEFEASINEEDLKKGKPYKDLEYIRHRFFEHPYYSYSIYQIVSDAETPLWMVTREVECNNSKILKIVDLYGEHQNLIGIAQILDAIIEERQYEYIDFYEYGIDDSIMKRSGMKLLDEEDPNIIPQYFEPFVPQNIEIAVGSKIPPGFCIFIANSDQDRPGIIKEG